MALGPALYHRARSALIHCQVYHMDNEINCTVGWPDTVNSLPSSSVHPVLILQPVGICNDNFLLDLDLTFGHIHLLKADVLP